MKNYVFIFAILIGFFYTSYLGAQVTIGLGEEPEKGALLQIKERENISDSTRNAYRGLGLPRVILSDKNQLYPMFLLDPDNPLSTSANNDYNNAAKKEVEDKKHTGLIVYNLVEDVENGLCKGLNQWNGREWTCFETRKGQSIFTIADCSNDIKVYGGYSNGESLSSSNFLTINVTVTKAGAYSITATATDPANDNEYFFITSGEFLSTGTFSLVIPGMGTPKDPQVDQFTVSINGVRENGSNPACTFSITVADSSIRPNYTLRCNTTKAFGVLKLNTELDPTNYIEVYLDVPVASYGATYDIKTDVVDGVYYKASGILSASMVLQPIKLMGFGTPTSTGKKTVTISTNSESNSATCKAFIDVALTPKKILTLGTYSGVYGYAFSGSPSNGLGLSQSAKLIKTAANFGLLENSIVKVENIIVNDDNIGDYTPTAAQLKTELDAMPAVVILGVYYTPDDASCQHFVDYLAKGGVLLAFLEFGGSELINQTIFGNKSITSTTINAGGAVYALPYNNDEILNGPFGDIRGKQWGEDATATRAFSNIPAGSIISYSTGDDMTQTATANTDKLTMFRHTSLNYLYCGDGGFNSGYSDFIYRYAYPFRVDESNNNKPIPRAVYGRGTTYNVYNSVLTANAIAWGLKKAQEREDETKQP